MKRTAFFEIHRQLGAKLVEFGGYEMPVQYAGIIEEHKAVRSGVGLFDVSHMGEFEIRGSGAQALVQRLTTNDVSRLADGKAQYSAMCYPDGGIVDDLLVYKTGSSFMLVVNASNIAKDLEWVRSNAPGLGAEVLDRSDETSLLAIQGPKSLAALQKITPADLAAIPYYSFVRATVAGVPMIVSRTGYTGELGFEIYFDSSVETGAKVWNAVMASGKEYGIVPVGLGARDTLRLEMGYCLYGNDIDATTNPLEAGLGWITKLDKGEFIGGAELKKVKREGVKRKLVGFTMEEERAFPRHGYEIRLDGEELGHVTSGTISPVLEKGVGLGYVAAAKSTPGLEVNILIRTRQVRARITNIPFIKREGNGG
jgi:glycine cleavage system T protein (aminomethyltransferase)